MSIYFITQKIGTRKRWIGLYDTVDIGYGVFIIVDVTITNNAEKRDLDLAKFHIMNGTKDYTYTAKTYGTEFQDLGDTYKSKELRRDE